jgi:hypothetical protein
MFQINFDQKPGSIGAGRLLFVSGPGACIQRRAEARQLRQRTSPFSTRPDACIQRIPTPAELLAKDRFATSCCKRRASSSASLPPRGKDRTPFRARTFA